MSGWYLPPVIVLMFEYCIRFGFAGIAWLLIIILVVTRMKVKVPNKKKNAHIEETTVCCKTLFIF